MNLPGLTLFRRGKIRDTYQLPPPDDDQLLMVASDRISAFDVILPTPIPGKGIVLTQLAAFWFDQTRQLVPNHLISTELADLPAALQSAATPLAGRMMRVQRADRIDYECVVRGYLVGSGWADYRRTGTVGGHRLPAGLREADRLPEPIFTPATKSDSGHDQNITVAEMAAALGDELTAQLEQLSLALYRFAAAYALERGIIIADTKFEFGRRDGQLILIDEILTPDSSRFWRVDDYAPGQSPASLDKQFVRDWLAASGWNKEPPAPALPPDVVAGTQARYRAAYEQLTGRSLAAFDAVFRGEAL